VQRNRERALVQQARAAIAREIADNSKDLEGGLKSLDKHVQDLAQGLRLADDLLKDGKSDIHELNLGFSFPSLNRAAWQTAERTGALALMDYDDVKELSELYELQDLVVGSQRQLLDRLAGLSAIMGAGEGGDPTKSAAQDLQVFRSRLLDARGAVSVHRSLAAGLADAYRMREQPGPR
jgi:hypothetical protein